MGIVTNTLTVDWENLDIVNVKTVIIAGDPNDLNSGAGVWTIRRDDLAAKIAECFGGAQPVAIDLTDLTQPVTAQAGW